jgi:KDO2-lipid IV(A) lauroyltransferase
MGLFLRFLAALAAALPRHAVDLGGRLLGLFWYYVLPVRRGVALDNIRRAYGDQVNARDLCRGNYLHLMRNVAEFLRVVGGGMRMVRPFIHYAGEEHYEDAMRRGRGVIIISGHIGNFDLMGLSVRDRGVPVKILSKHARVKVVDRFWHESRTGLGARLIPRRDSVREILQTLRKGEIMGFIIDQHQSGDASIVDFYGRIAATTNAPAIFADRTGAPVIPIFTYRRPDGHHVVEFHPDAGFERISEDRAENIRHNTQRYTRIIEKAVRRAPEQWLWVHRRWKAATRKGL